MKDEEFLFMQDSREKKNIARSARNAKTHAGKRGRVKLPSDYMTRKELRAMSGECKSYRLNEPMKWKEFKAMPDDLKVTYIKLLRQKYNARDVDVAEMLGISKATMIKEVARLGLSQGKAAGARKRVWDKEGFYAWANGVPAQPATEDMPECEEEQTMPAIIEEFEKHPANEESVIAAELPPPLVIKKAIPKHGTLTFNCAANAAMETIASLLGDMRVTITVAWEEDCTTVGCEREAV